MALVLLVATSVFAQSVPRSVEQKMRQIYAERYPDNSSMQKTLINKQLKSYRFIQCWTSEPGVPQDVFSKEKTIYAQKYPYNFSMQKILIKNQCKSYRFIQSYTFETDVPKSVIANLKQKYAQKYPYNFSKQKTLVQNQVQSYLDLKQWIANRDRAPHHWGALPHQTPGPQITSPRQDTRGLEDYLRLIIRAISAIGSKPQ